MSRTRYKEYIKIRVSSSEYGRPCTIHLPDGNEDCAAPARRVNQRVAILGAPETPKVTRKATSRPRDRGGRKVVEGRRNWVMGRVRQTMACRGRRGGEQNQAPPCDGGAVLGRTQKNFTSRTTDGSGAATRRTYNRLRAGRHAACFNSHRSGETNNLVNCYPAYNSNILLSTQSALHLAPVFTRHRRFVPLPAPL